LSFIHFTHGFRSLHGSELTYFWKLCQVRRQKLTFFSQAWEIGPQAWAGVRSKFSTRRRETHAQGVRVGRYKICFKLQGHNAVAHNLWKLWKGSDKLIKMVNLKLSNEMRRWINQHDTSVGIFLCPMLVSCWLIHLVFTFH